MGQQFGHDTIRAAEFYAGVTLSHPSVRDFGDRFLDIDLFSPAGYCAARTLLAELCAVESEYAWRTEHMSLFGGLSGADSDASEVRERASLRELAVEIVIELSKAGRDDLALYLADTMILLRQEMIRSGRRMELIRNPYFSSRCGPQN